MSLRFLILVWAALACLLALTIGNSFLLSGTPGLVASLGIAAAKAALIYWVFMHLRMEGGLIRLAALGVMVWLMILFGMVLSDYLTRETTEDSSQHISIIQPSIN